MLAAATVAERWGPPARDLTQPLENSRTLDPGPGRSAGGGEEEVFLLIIEPVGFKILRTPSSLPGPDGWFGRTQHSVTFS